MLFVELFDPFAKVIDLQGLCIAGTESVSSAIFIDDSRFNELIDLLILGAQIFLELSVDHLDFSVKRRLREQWLHEKLWKLIESLSKFIFCNIEVINRNIFTSHSIVVTAIIRQKLSVKAGVRILNRPLEQHMLTEMSQALHIFGVIHVANVDSEWAGSDLSLLVWNE